jgi:hypothetical protein
MDMLKDLKSFRLKPHAQQPDQPTVVHAAAAQRHLRHSRSRTRPHRRLRKARGHSGMKPSRNPSLVYSGPQIFNGSRRAQSPPVNSIW